MVESKQNVPRGTFDITPNVEQKFAEYLDLIKKWNRKINLSSRSQDIESVFDESATEVLVISGNMKGKKILDVGSGGGFPGMFLGILGHEISLLEINTKKCVFLQEVVNKLRLGNVKIINADVKKHQGNYDVIISKAVTSVSNLVEMTAHLISANTEIYLPKSVDQLSELDELEKRWSFELRKEEIKDINRDVILILSSLISK